MPLTVDQIENAKPGLRPLKPHGENEQISNPSGGKYWRFKYRFPKEKRISLGVYPEVSLEDASAAKDECRKQLAKGIDPGVARKAQKAARASKAANSFEVVAREWLKANIDPKAGSHRKRVYARFENDIFPYLGSRPIADITPPELLDVIRKIETAALGTLPTAPLEAADKCFATGSLPAAAKRTSRPIYVEI